MTDTLARLVGPEGELVAELLVEGCPPVIRQAVLDRPTYYAPLNEPDPVALRIQTIEYVREFMVPGTTRTTFDGQRSTYNIATYRRALTTKATKEPRSK